MSIMYLNQNGECIAIAYLGNEKNAISHNFVTPSNRCMEN